jgi:hypothetical protein
MVAASAVATVEVVWAVLVFVECGLGDVDIVVLQ